MAADTAAGPLAAADEAAQGASATHHGSGDHEPDMAADTDAHLAAAGPLAAADEAAQGAAASPPPRRLMIIASLVFGLRFIALAAFSPYVFLWLESNGFNAHERGLLGSVYAVVRFGAPVLLGSLADWSGRRSAVFAAATVLNGMAVAALTLQPTSTACQAVVLGLCSITDTGSLLDAFVMRSLAWSGSAAAAPKARAWGALTWCAAAPLFGVIAQGLGISALFRAYGCFQLVALPVCLLLPISQAYGEEGTGKASPAAVVTSTGGESKGAPRERPGTAEMEAGAAGCDDGAGTDSAGCAGSAPDEPAWSFSQRVGRALGGSGEASRQLRFAMPLLALVGLQMGIGFTFGFIYLKEELHAPGFLVGLSLTAQASVEVPLFRAASAIVARLGGLRPALLSTSLAGALRFCGWAVAPNAWAVLPFECGHGWAFALSYTSMATIGDLFAEDKLQATVVGLLSSCMGLGNLAATSGWGFVVEGLGLRASFSAAAAIFGLASLPLLVHTRQCARAVCGCAAEGGGSSGGRCDVCGVCDWRRPRARARGVEAAVLMRSMAMGQGDVAEALPGVGEPAAACVVLARDEGGSGTCGSGAHTAT